MFQYAFDIFIFFVEIDHFQRCQTIIKLRHSHDFLFSLHISSYHRVRALALVSTSMEEI